MELRFYLDDVLYDDPFDHDDLIITLERDSTIKGLVKKFTNKFTFQGAAYTYLNNKKINSGFCSETEVKVQYLQDYWRTLFTGTIKTKNTTFTHYPINTAEVAIEDNAFTTLINNNRKIKTRVQGLTTSKNGVTITTVTPEQIDFYDSLTGNYDFLNRNSYNASECLRFLVAFMTDDQVDYSSPLFETGGDLDNIYFTTGHDLNLNGGIPLTISFEDAFTELNKRFNISFTMDYSGIKPTIIIDRTEDLYSDDISETLQNPDAVKETVNVSELYSVIKFGGPHVINDGSDEDANFPEEPFIGFRPEEYNILGQCNAGVIEDLEQHWISDHNTTHIVVKDGVNEYDEDVFVFEADPADHTKARKYDTYNPGTAPYFYNLSMTNQAVAINYIGGIPAPIASYLGDALNVFTAGLTADYFVVDGPIIWDKDTPPEGQDLGGNYDTTTGRYTAVASGGHGFHTRMRIYFDTVALTGVPYSTEIAKLYIRRYNSSDVLLDSAILPSIYYVSGVYGFAFNTSIFMNAGDYVTMEADTFYDAAYIATTDYFVPAGYSIFECTSAPDEGGTYMKYDSGDYRIMNYNFNFPVSLTRMENILNNEEKKIAFTLGNKTYSGWIKKIEFKVTKTMADITLLTRQNDNV